MDMPIDSQKPAAASEQKPQVTKATSSNTRTQYLIAYNLVSAVLWSAILGRDIAFLLQGKIHDVHRDIGTYVKYVQTLAGLEIIHSLIGLVRAPLLTTIMQVASRFLLVWGIVHFFPEVATSPAYSSMLFAWSATEVIRYTYFALQLRNGEVPGYLKWLRYNTFFVLYPLGISSECWLVYQATGSAGKRDEKIVWALWAVLAVYVPGSYILFTHMMAQRRRVMRSTSSKKVK